jgi:hypothetical protein
MRSSLENPVGSRAAKVVRLWVARVRMSFRKEGSRCQVNRLRVCDRESQMRATLAVTAKRSKEARSGVVQRSEEAFSFRFEVRE